MGFRFTESLVLSAAAVALFVTAGPADARHRRIIAIAHEPGVCNVAPRPLPFIYPAPDWRPFFHKHYYRFGPTPTCVWSEAPVVPVAQTIISVRY
ncbi:hypothetical protein ACQR1Y_32730 [Bradyrhizobium sp. HKCCYLRH3099]|uniref:hypothetical protein n=1 Tax=unclassified Bradyrhizobium TaxID=2631580 RepID=UPI003EBFD635